MSCYSSPPLLSCQIFRLPITIAVTADICITKAVNTPLAARGVDCQDLVNKQIHPASPFDTPAAGITSPITSQSLVNCFCVIFHRFVHDFGDDLGLLGAMGLYHNFGRFWDLGLKWFILRAGWCCITQVHLDAQSLGITNKNRQKANEFESYCIIKVDVFFFERNHLYQTRIQTLPLPVTQ